MRKIPGYSLFVAVNFALFPFIMFNKNQGTRGVYRWWWWGGGVYNIRVDILCQYILSQNFYLICICTLIMTLRY